QVVIDYQDYACAGGRLWIAGFRLFNSRPRFRFTIHHLRGQGHGESSPLPERAFHFDVAAHHIAESPADHQTQTGASEPACDRGVSLAERSEQLVHLFRRDSDARVRDLENNLFAAYSRLPDHLQSDVSVLGELAGIAEQIEQTLAHLGQVRV